MFEVSLSSLVMIYLALPLVAILVLWFIFDYKQLRTQKKYRKQEQWMLKCPICLHSFVSPKKDSLVKCPACAHFFQAQEAQLEST